MKGSSDRALSLAAILIIYQADVLKKFAKKHLIGIHSNLTLKWNCRFVPHKLMSRQYKCIIGTQTASSMLNYSNKNKVSSELLGLIKTWDSKDKK